MPTGNAIATEFAFHVEYVNENGDVLQDRRLRQADFAHAVRHTKFDAFRCGEVDEYHPSIEGARIVPLFPTGERTSARAKGFCVVLPLADGGEHACEFDINYFAASAKRLRAEMQRAQTMPDDAHLYYRLNAFLDDEEPAQPANKLAVSLEPAAGGIAVVAGRLGDFPPAAVWGNPSPSDLPVLFDIGVLEEVVEEARAYPEREIAGFLFGQLMRDETSNKVFVVVTGLASATDTSEASSTFVTYTPASFAEARRILKLRNRPGEGVAGWYHSHPWRLCSECPVVPPPECIAKVLFYSLDDFHLMETTFEQPFMVGLVAAVDSRIEAALGHPPVKLYGWQNGEIKDRGFDVVRVR
jgi:proteasome lid subunit RPN8/RPN11